MKNSVFALAAALVATTATIAVAQTPNSDFRGPVATDYSSYSAAPRMEADFGNFSDEIRFNDFSGPVVRQ